MPGQEGAKGHAPNLTEIRVPSVGKSIRMSHLRFQGNMDSLPLLSKSTLLKLGMLIIDPEGTLKGGET